MPSKKKKYNSRFPPARIKKIMQTDEDIGKVAAAVPVLISKCLEMFLTSLLQKAGDVTRSKRAKTMSRMHLKECIMSETMFDFLQDQVAHIQDLQGDEEPTMSSTVVPAAEISSKVTRKRSQPKTKKNPKKRLKLDDGSGHEIDDHGDQSDATNEPNDLSHASRLLISMERKPTPPSESEASSSKHSHPIRIPGGTLVTGNENSGPVKVEGPSSAFDGSMVPHDTKSKPGQRSLTKFEPSSVSESMKFDASSIRPAVIVTNSIANYTSPTLLQTTLNLKAEVTSKHDSPVSHVSAAVGESQQITRQESYSVTDSRRESMLSLLHDPAPVVAHDATVSSHALSDSHQKYAYNPLSQQPPMYYPEMQPSGNGDNASSFSRQIPSHVPAASQRHFLGYSQSILTPSGQNPLLAVHTGMAQMKPTPTSRHDDDDDYDT